MSVAVGVNAVMSDSLARVLKALPSARKQGAGWVALCPVHDDHVASLSIGEGRDGRVLLCCHAGCPRLAVVKALGLTMSDLFARADRTRSAKLVAAYDYTGQDGKLLFQVARLAQPPTPT